jgi:hypothetical protein
VQTTERIAELTGARKPVGGIFRHRLHDGAGHVFGHLRAPRAERRGRFVEVPGHDGARARADEWRVAGKHLVDDTA